jgi:hypothetical protein
MAVPQWREQAGQPRRPYEVYLAPPPKNPQGSPARHNRRDGTAVVEGNGAVIDSLATADGAAMLSAELAAVRDRLRDLQSIYAWALFRMSR